MKAELPLCFYPTQIVFVDDNEDFLAALKLALSSKFRIKTFSDPQQALNYIQENQRQLDLAEDGEKPPLHGDSDTWVKQVLSHPNIKRFDAIREHEISVLIIDYSMPSMTGIEFCEQIQKTHTKRILLTGYATPSDAVKAFNNHVIHYYLTKNDPNMLRELEDAILQLQSIYFRELSSRLKTDAMDSETPFFTDSALADYFQNLCNHHGIREYYYLASPSRFVMRDKNNDEHVCVIYSEEDMLEQIQILQEEDAPATLIEKLSSRRYVPYFPTADGFYVPELDDADDYLHEATEIRGETLYYCAFVAEQKVAPEATPATRPTRLH